MDDVCDLFDESLSSARARGRCGAVDGSRRSAAARRGARAGAGRERRAPAELRRCATSGCWRSCARTSGRRPRSSVWIGCPVRWFVERMLRPGAFDPDAEPLARGRAGPRGAQGHARGAPRARPARPRLDARQPRAARASCSRGRSRDNEAELPAVGGAGAAAGGAPAPAGGPGALPASTRPRPPARWSRSRWSWASASPRTTRPAPGWRVGEASELPALDLGDGVRLRGRIDRVDVERRRARRSSTTTRAAARRRRARWIRDGNVQVALYMRAVESLLAPVGGRRLLPAADRRGPARPRRARR